MCELYRENSLSVTLVDEVFFCCCFGLLSSFPGFIAAMSDLVKALNEHVSSKDWDKAVASKLDKFASAVSNISGRLVAIVVAS